MKYRKLGSAGVEVSEIVFGAGAVGGIVFKPERPTRLEAVCRALAAGINWIDTAPSYGDGQSEANLGWILKELRADPHISTKVRIDASHASDVAGEVRRSMERSLARLGRQSVDLVQLHTRIVMTTPASNGVDVDFVLRKGGIADALDGIRAEGMTRFIGITGLGDTQAVHAVVVSKRFDTVQAYHNLLNPSAGRRVSQSFTAQDYGDLIGAAHAAGMGVFNIRVLAAGVAAGRQPPDAAGPAMSAGSDPASDRRRADSVNQALAEEEGTPAQRAIRFALADRRISGVLVGFAALEHIDEAVEASTIGPLPESAIKRLEELWRTDYGRAG